MKFVNYINIYLIKRRLIFLYDSYNNKNVNYENKINNLFNGLNYEKINHLVSILDDDFFVNILCILKNKKLVLATNSFREKLIASSNDAFYMVLTQFCEEEYDCFLDERFMSDITNSNNYINILGSILKINYSKKSQLLMNDMCISTILKHDLFGNFYDKHLGEYIIDYALRIDKGALKLFSSVDLKGQIELLNDVLFINKLTKIGLNQRETAEFFFGLKDETINSIILNKNNVFYDVYKENIDKLFVNISNYKYMPSCEVILDDNFRNYLVSINEPYQYRFFINILSSNILNINSIGIIEKLRKELLNDLIEFYINNKSISQLYKNEYIFNIIIDTFFKRYSYDFLIDLNMMVNYCIRYDFNVFSDNLKLYKYILEYDFKNGDYKELLEKFSFDVEYDRIFQRDYDNCFMDANKDLASSLIDFNGKNRIKLDGESFCALVHCSNIRNDDCRGLLGFSNLEWMDRNINSSIISLSLIGNDNINVFNKDNVIFGFDNIDINKIEHVSNTDSYSNQVAKTKKINVLLRANDLIKSSVGYNEILYKSSKELKPKYICCFDKITITSKKLAEYYSVPILLIDSMKYGCTEFKNEEIMENFYREREGFLYLDLDDEYGNGKKL